MGKLFSKSYERQRGRFDASEIEVIGVGCGGTNIVNYMQTHGFKDVPLAVCDMDASVIERTKVQEKNITRHGWIGCWQQSGTWEE